MSTKSRTLIKTLEREGYFQYSNFLPTMSGAFPQFYKNCIKMFNEYQECFTNKTL